jgi:hypothetical protein
MDTNINLQQRLKSFAEEHRSILQREIDEEIKQAEKLLETSSLDDLEYKGIVIQDLQLHQVSLVSYGDYEYIFKRGN